MTCQSAGAQAPDAARFVDMPVRQGLVHMECNLLAEYERPGIVREDHHQGALHQCRDGVCRDLQNRYHACTHHSSIGYALYQMPVVIRLRPTPYPRESLGRRGGRSAFLRAPSYALS